MKRCLQWLTEQMMTTLVWKQSCRTWSQKGTGYLSYQQTENSMFYQSYTLFKIRIRKKFSNQSYMNWLLFYDNITEWCCIQIFRLLKDHLLQKNNKKTIIHEQMYKSTLCIFLQNLELRKCYLNKSKNIKCEFTCQSRWFS